MGAALVLAPEVTVPLMVVAGTAGLMDVSDMGEGLNQMITGKSKGANFIRDDVMRPVLGNKADLVYDLTDVSTNLVVPTGGLAELVKGSALVEKASVAKSLVVQSAKSGGVTFGRTFMSEMSKGGVRASFMGTGEVGKGVKAASKATLSGVQKAKATFNAGRVTEKAQNMEEVFGKNDFGKALQDASQKTAEQYQGQSVYKVVVKVPEYGLKKGDQFYLDGLHKDHIEVFNKQGLPRSVRNLDGTINNDKFGKINGRFLKK